MHHPPSVDDQQKIAELDGHEIRLQRSVAELEGSRDQAIKVSN